MKRISWKCWWPLPLQETVNYHQVALVFREPNIYTGYRLPGQSWSYYLASLFQIHNELGNVWSHILTSLIHAYLAMYTYLNPGTDHPDIIGVIGFHVMHCTCANLSVMAHLFHSKSVYHHYTLFMYDYIGIAMHIHGCATLHYHCLGTETLYQYFGHFYLFMNSSVAVLFYAVAAAAKGFLEHNYLVERRVLTCIIGVVVTMHAALPLMFKTYEDYHWNNSVFSPHSHAVLWYIFSMTIHVLKLPETILPGQFDIIGHSHQWWHILNLTAAMKTYHEAHHDLLKKAPGIYSPTGGMTMMISYFQLLGICLVLQYAVMYPLVSKIVQNTKGYDASCDFYSNDMQKQQ